MRLDLPMCAFTFGAFWASALCGLLGTTLGWWAGFGLAGVGMLAGFVVFVLGKKHLQGKGEPPNPELLKKPVLGPLNREWLIYLAGVAGVIPVYWLVQRNDVVGGALSISTVLALLAIVGIIVFVCKTRVERERMMLATVLIIGAVVAMVSGRPREAEEPGPSPDAWRRVGSGRETSWRSAWSRRPSC